jgi:hypothetical protein
MEYNIPIIGFSLRFVEVIVGLDEEMMMSSRIDWISFSKIPAIIFILSFSTIAFG